MAYVIQFLLPFNKVGPTFLFDNGNPINNEYGHCFATTSLIESAVKFDTWKEARKATEYFKEFDYGTEIIIRKISV